MSAIKLNRLIDNCATHLVLGVVSIFLTFLTVPVYSQLFTYSTGHLSVFMFVVAYAGACYFVLPLLFSKGILGKSLAEVGLLFPKERLRSLLYVGAGYLICLPLLYLMVSERHFHEFYRYQHTSLSNFLLIQFLCAPLYMLFEEFFFRGFVFLSLWRKMGWHALWITEALFTWAHLTKPLIEVGVSVPVGMILNLLTLKTRSIYPAVLLHYLFGLTANILINLNLVTVSW